MIEGRIDVSQAADCIVVVNDVTKSFGPVRALRGVSLDFRRGEVLALVGENGAGKSTLMRVLEGEHTPDRGTVQVAGQPVLIANPRQAHALGIRVIHQEPEIIPELSVAENIFIGDIRSRALLFLDQHDLHRRTQALLEEFGMADVLSAQEPARGLGPAQRQLIEIMRALRPGARLLAFDEPTSSLTEDESTRLFAVIRRLAASGVSIIYISHRLREVIALADRVAVLRDGEVVAVESVASIDEDRVVQMMVGRPVTDLFQRPQRSAGAVRLALDGVTTDSVRDISFDVRAGEIVGLGGLVGAGRTEVARAVFGVDTLRAGSISVMGRPTRIRSPRDAIAAGIGLVPEDRKQEALLLMQPVRDNVSLVVPEKVSRFGFFEPRRESGLVTEFVDKLRVKTPSIMQLVSKLSGGNQQKVVFARWLTRQPNVLILDEPTRGVDVGAKAEIYRLIESLAVAGMAILLISSEMQELLGLADRVIVMSEGRVSGELAGDTATEEAVLRLAMRHNETRRGS